MTSFARALMSGAAIATIAAGSAMAQDDEIIVTATKRPQTLQEVPVAVSVVGADTVEKARVQDLFDLQSVVPSLRVSQLQNSSQTTFIIRGFGNGANNPGIESSVGVFIDGVFRSRSASAILDLPTLERVEVLRGPQSTLFGKNTSAGAISITTKKPEYEWGGSVEAQYGNYDHMVVRGTLTGPLSDTLAFRVSGSVNKRDGYYTNLIDGEDLNERDRWAARAQLLWEPTDTLSFRAIGEYNRIDEQCCGVTQIVNGPATQAIGAPPPFGLGLPIGPIQSYNVVQAVPPNNELTGRGLSLQADWDIGWAQVTSITAYREQTDTSDTEIGFSGAELGTNPQDRLFETFTQELRIASVGDNRINWLLGAFYFDETVDFSRDIIYGRDIRSFVNLLAGPATLGSLEAGLGLPSGTFFGEGQGVFGDYLMDNVSYSIFGNIDFELTDRLTLSGGVSYINDSKDVIGTSVLTDVFSNLNLVEVGFGSIFGALTGLPPTPANIGANPVAAGTANALSTIPCTATNPPPACNPLLGLGTLQFFDPQVSFPNANPDDNGQLDGDKVTYQVRLAYDLTDAINTYFTYATGWKAGAFNLSSDSSPPNSNGLGRSALPEDVRLFEFGVKTKFDGGYLNLALFDQKIDGFQSNLFVGTAFTLANAGSQSVRGFEVEAAYSPVDPLDLTFALTYLDPEFDSFPNAPCASFIPECAGPAPGVPGPVFFDASGTRPAGIHPVSIATSAVYNVDFSNGATGYLRAEYQYESPTQVVDNVSRTVAERDQSLLQLSAGYELENGFGLQIWARNVLNDTYLQSAFPTVVQTGSFSGYLNEPRTIGGTIRKKF